MCQQQGKTSRTGKRAIQLAASAVEGSLDLDLLFSVLFSFPAAVTELFQGVFKCVHRQFWVEG
jgi:hypothetical protein